jgi:hypothetical protein
MSNNVKIETVNKISQIYSVDIHCNPLIVDVRLDVEKNVAATSEPMKDEDSAKANAYAKAKGEFKVDVIVDPSFIITKNYSNALFAFIAAITFGFLKFGVRFTVTISGYAGYYDNPRSYYEHQKRILEDLSNALKQAGDADANTVRILKSILQPEFTSSYSETTKKSSIFGKGKGLLGKIPLISKLF